MPRFGEGQWALGYTEPLNKNERMKRDAPPLEVRDRIDNIYSKQGFRSIWPDDLRGRFRWWGIYTQRRQGVPGGRTAAAEPHELEDEFFMMRIRLAGGQLTSEQLRTIAWVSERFGRDVADVTDRQNIQLHWIRIEDVPRIFQAIEGVGLTTCEACGDSPRTMIGCPLAGVDADELFDATPALIATHQRFVGDPEFQNLPRKFKTSISGCAQQCAQHEINDVAFVGVRRDDGAGPSTGYDLWAGGGLGPNPHFGKRLSAFVEMDQVPDVWAGIAGLFRDYGYRRARNHARLKFLMADWGPERVREVLEKEYLGYALPDSDPPQPTTTAQRDHVGVHPQRDGRLYVGFAPRAGRIYGHQLREVAHLADGFGTGLIRLTTQQKVVITNVEPTAADDLVAALDEHDLRVAPSVFRRQTMACTGIEFCKLAIVETKHRADWLYRELEERLPDFDEPIRINLNGCPNSCARFQVADIGLMGSLITASDGTKVDGYQVSLGGHLGDDHRFGRKVKRLKVPASELANYVERLLRRYLATRSDSEPFHVWAARAPEDWLQ
ncbi:MAG TPA: nitrite/sulfite reductase [Actinomycetota bacterium]|nr:nitrite/sulfite reductase [Actinomycetota bacterium]